ncbi:uncharacterized protein LOC128473736 [Spea bombifrons]|uniref:uncharacterized protein LOC128473736 n=1 Tax=Spea bombifrons TaxID=233779 RepID=UPI0023491F75|nr:uncharacterized protein LOC128473736 [Spea bombifrons]
MVVAVMAKRKRETSSQESNKVYDMNSAPEPHVDLITALDRNEKIFQEKMRKIFEKYNKPFENDLILNIEEMTAVTINGVEMFNGRKFEKKKIPRRHSAAKIQVLGESKNANNGGSIVHGECNLDVTQDLPLGNSKVSDDIFNETFEISDEDSNELPSKDENKGQLVEFKSLIPLVHLSDTRHGKTYVADADILLESDDHVPASKICIERKAGEGFSVTYSPLKTELNGPGCKKDISRRYIENGRSNHVSSPSKCSFFTQLKRFIGRHNSDIVPHGTTLLKIAKVEHETDDEFADDDEESNASDLGNISLADFYPNMIECLSRLIDFPRKERAATNIIRYYRRHVWCANKHRLDLVKAKQAFYKQKRSKLMLTSNPNKGSNQFAIDCKPSNRSPRHNSHMHTSGITECMERRPFSECLDTTQMLKVSKPYVPQVPVLSQTVILNADKTFTCNETCVTGSPERWRQKNELSARLPRFSSSLLRNSLLAKSPAKLLSETCLIQNPPKQYEIKSAVLCSPSHNRLVKQQHEVQSTLRRRHSFSTLPSLQRAAKSATDYSVAFELVYKKLVLEDSYQKSSSLSITQTCFSDTVNALVNSPGSNRGKRLASDDLSLSRLKRYRMADSFEPRVSRGSCADNWNSPWSRINVSPQMAALDTFQHRNSPRRNPDVFSSFGKPTQPQSLFPSGSSSQRVCNGGSPRSPKTCSSSTSLNRINNSVYRQLNYKYNN